MRNNEYMPVNKRLVSILFLLWMVSLPFRNSILSFSISEVKIYPNLLVTAVLVVCLLPTFFRFSKFQKFIALFLFAWALYAFGFMCMNGFTKDGIFDLHSLVMQFCVAFLFFGGLHVFGFDEFKKLLRDGLRFYLSLLLLFGVFEILSACHIEGVHTSNLARFPVYRSFWAPIFIYDNVNDYCMHLIILVGLLYMIDDYLQKNKFLIIALLIFLFFDAFLAQSRLGERIVFVYLLFFIGLFVVSKGRNYLQLTKRYVFYVLAMLICLIVVFVQNTFFDGRAFLKTPESTLNSSIIFNSETQQGTYYRYLDDITKKKVRLMNVLFPNFTPDVLSVYDTTNNVKFKAILPKDINHEQMSNSASPRLNLIYNGFDMVKEKPLLGHGPGSFIQQHKKQIFPRNTEYITQPHNFVIEIVSQFGIWAWIYLSLFVYLFFNIVMKRTQILSTDRTLFILLFLLIYPFIGAMSSSFLYITLHWCLLPFLVILLRSHTEDVALSIS